MTNMVEKATTTEGQVEAVNTMEGQLEQASTTKGQGVYTWSATVTNLALCRKKKKPGGPKLMPDKKKLKRKQSRHFGGLGALSSM
nr:uncharacterized protein LOC129416401 isoform X10 [Misgurnus anguillicaudatus]